MSSWHQNPPPGDRRILHCGDLLIVTLFSNESRPGSAWLRTNLGRAQDRRNEIIFHVERRTPVLARDWHDLPMRPSANERVFEIQVPLFETGRFEAKAFFLPEGTSDPVWPEGENLIIKVEPAVSFCANTIYTAFVRQFGPNMTKAQELPVAPETLAALDENGFAIIPKSGTFRALNARLDHIIGTLGFRIIQLLPIHPVPTTFARMGRFGSPFAAIDFLNVDPALAEFDRKHTPLDQFAELVDSVHQRNAMIFLDLPINHTGWASDLQLHHPEWFARNDDQTFASPGAWGVTWEDLSKLDYHHRGLWQYMADVFLFWCAKGVDGFRCDAGYMVPLPVWEYIVAKVRQTYPDTIFLLEGLGGKISVMRDLLESANLNWAYSEIFQVYDRHQLEQEITHNHDVSRRSGTLINFAETHDNNRLAATSRTYARMRTALAALCSDNGTFGITNGVEWFAEAKVDVHGAPPLNWNCPENQITEIATLNSILKAHPAFHPGTRLRFISAQGPVLSLLREPYDSPPVLVLINLDTEHSASAAWPESLLPDAETLRIDLLSGKTVPVETAQSGMQSLMLTPAQTLCLAARPLPGIPSSQDSEAITRQRARAMAMALYSRLASPTLPPDLEPDAMADALSEDPRAFCETICGHSFLNVLTPWQWPADLNRTVMLPDHHRLLVECPYPFQASIHDPGRNSDLCIARSLPQHQTDRHFVFLSLDSDLSLPATLSLRLTLFKPGEILHANAELLALDSGKDPQILRTFDREQLRDSRRCALLTNGRGAMSQVRLEWGRLISQYDAILAANLDDLVPVDRRILLTRCRAWLVHMGYSHEIGLDCTQHAVVIPGKEVQWYFDVPAGLGLTVPLVFVLRLIPHCNRVELQILRRHQDGQINRLADDQPVSLILRPDIEDRNFHESSKAYSGPETLWPSVIDPRQDGFRFSPEGHSPLVLKLEGGCFVQEPQWLYGVPHPFEADRGLENSGDLFSPGYFSIPINGGGQCCLNAFIEGVPEAARSSPDPAIPETGNRRLPIASMLESTIHDFIVKRDHSRTVIAGYPWFLDWGRDTLICLRGIIAAGLIDEARDILLQFACFEHQGTLPNMIRGQDDRNRDTSDAPLWFFTACRDLMQATGDQDFLSTDCKGRTLLEVLRSLATHMVNGTPNGIVMDQESGLIFSPSHFTWMDTNFPAGTPREGYPIEIQALWYAALQLLIEIDGGKLWLELITKVKDSISIYYSIPGRHYLSDCLHASAGTPAGKAVADNALRPNQLLAITLGALDESAQVRGILQETATLLIPGAIRSLADRPVSPPLPVYGPHGLLNNPDHPYWGEYQGDEDSRRKPAYHNGTAWTWLFPSYCEAMATHDLELVPTALSLLSSCADLMSEGCVGHLPEILDGNRPHRQRGCWAQAWSTTEVARVLKKLRSLLKE